jgi:hypothetical protein
MAVQVATTKPTAERAETTIRAIAGICPPSPGDDGFLPNRGLDRFPFAGGGTKLSGRATSFLGLRFQYFQAAEAPKLMLDCNGSGLYWGLISHQGCNVMNVPKLIVCLALGSAAAFGDSITIGAPGNPFDGDCAPFGCTLEYQQVYGSGLFPGAISITGLTFFNDNFVPGSIANADYPPEAVTP